jgi:hypothetical protein
MRDRHRVRAARCGAAIQLAVAALGGLALIGGAHAPALPTAAAAATTRSNCTSTTRQVVKRFTRAIRDGSADRADKTYAREPAFEWYSTTAPGTRLNADARDRTTLREYFRDRIARHERLRLTRLTAFYERRRNITHFHGTLARSADNLPVTTHHFKGAATCRGRTRIIVWSMSSGRDASREVEPPAQ